MANQAIVGMVGPPLIATLVPRITCDAVQAANDVNARMARALGRAKAVSGVDAATAGYGSYPISEPNRPVRWRVSQTLALDGADGILGAGQGQHSPFSATLAVADVDLHLVAELPDWAAPAFDGLEIE